LVRRLAKWFFFSLRRQLACPGFWGVALLLLLVEYLLFSVIVPEKGQVPVLLCTQEADGISLEVIDSLTRENHLFFYIQVDSREEVSRKLERMEADCAFIFPSDFTERVRAHSLEQCVEYLHGPSSLRGVVAKEAVYAAFYREYSKILLTELEQGERIYVTHEPGRLEQILKANEKYQENGTTFSFAYENDLFEGKDIDAQRRDFDLPVKGVTALFLFMAVLFTYGTVWQEKGAYLLLPYRQRTWFHMVELYGRSILFLLPALLGIFYAGGGRGIALKALSLAGYLFLCSAWTVLWGKCTGSQVGYYCMLPVLLAAVVAITPVFINTEAILPAFGLLKWLFPVTYYILL